MALLPESASPPNGVVDFSKTKSALPPEDDLEDGEIFDDEDDEPQEYPPQQSTVQQQRHAEVTTTTKSLGPRRSNSPQSGGGGVNVGNSTSGSNSNNNQIAHNNNALNENCGGFSRSSADSRRGSPPLADRGKGRGRTRRKRPREEERHQTFMRKKRRTEGNESKALREKNIAEEEEIFEEPQNLNQPNEWDDRPQRSEEEDEEMGFDERQRGGSGDRRRANASASGRSQPSAGGQNRQRRSRQRNQNNKKAQRNGRELKSVCKYFLNGHCQRGADCPFSHSTNPLRKFEVCKFYQNDCCAKKDSCVYMHSDYPCRFHHLGLKCYAGKRCKFSHSKVTPYTKQMLIKQNQTEADKHFLQTLPTTSPRRGDSRSPTPDFEYNNSGGNSGRRHPTSHHSNDFQMDDNEGGGGGDEYDQNDEYPEEFDHHSNDHPQRNQMHHQQDFREDQQHQQQMQQQQQQQQTHHHHHHDNMMRGGDRDRVNDRGNDRGERGYRGERDGQRNLGRSGRGGGGGRRQNQRNRRRSPDRIGPRHHSQYDPKSQSDFNHFDDSGNEEGNTPMPSPTGENLGERDLDEEEGELGFEQPAEVPTDWNSEPDSAPFAAPVDRPDLTVNAPAEQFSSQPLETKKESPDEQDIPPNLPKTQRELYLRIQQQQQQRDTHNVKQDNEYDEKEAEYKEEDWYSSDDEANSRPLDVILNKIKPKTLPVKTDVKKEEITASLLDFDVSAVSKILSSVRETIEQNKQSETDKPTEPQKPEEKRKARDPRLMRARTPPLISRFENASVPQLPSLVTPRPTTQAPSKQVDVDLRVARSAADVDLRQLPFKPAPVHQAANEIDASINANPSITYCPRPFTPPPKPDYSHIPIKNPNDPRLRKYIVAGAMPSQPLPTVTPITTLPSFMMGPGVPPVGPQPPSGGGIVMMNPTQPLPQRPPPQMVPSQPVQSVPRDPRQRALANDPRRKPLLPTPPGPPNMAVMGPNMMPPMGMPVVGMPMNMSPMQPPLVMGPHQGQMYGHGHPPMHGGQDSDLRRPPGGPFPLGGDVDLRFQQGNPSHFPFK